MIELKTHLNIVPTWCRARFLENRVPFDTCGGGYAHAKHLTSMTHPRFLIVEVVVEVNEMSLYKLKVEMKVACEPV